MLERSSRRHLLDKEIHCFTSYSPKHLESNNDSSHFTELTIGQGLFYMLDFYVNCHISSFKLHNNPMKLGAIIISFTNEKTEEQRLYITCWSCDLNQVI